MIICQDEISNKRYTYQRRRWVADLEVVGEADHQEVEKDQKVATGNKVDQLANKHSQSLSWLLCKILVPVWTIILIILTGLTVLTILTI